MHERVRTVALLSTLRVLDRARIQKERKLPAPGDVLVQAGDTVNADTVIAKADFVRGNPYVVDLRAEFKQKVDPEFVDSVLIKKQGDTVRVRDVIARYQKSFWSDIIEVRSPCTGTIEYISRTQGRIVIREDPRSSSPLSVVPAASKLGVWPRLLRMYTRVNEGDFVYEGQIIADAHEAGLVDFVYAPMSGIIRKICTLTGTITIARPIKHTRLLAHISGRVTRLIPDYGAVIESTGAYIQGVFGIGNECSGELMVLADGPEEPLRHDGIDESVQGKILVAGSFASLDSIKKAMSKGAVGLITGGMNQLDLVSVLGKELTVGITGHETSDFPIVILEGFGEIPMNQGTWDILASSAGKIASIDGTTQIRAGVLRPEVIICSDDSEDQPGGPDKAVRQVMPLVPGHIDELPQVVYSHVRQGDRVRCTRPPYFGLWGIVEDVPPMPEKIQCEIITEVALIRLDDGRPIKVPQANLEVFHTGQPGRRVF